MLFVLFCLKQAQCKTKTVRKSDGSCACGFMLEFGLTWRKAADKCKSLGARLPEIRNEQENNDVSSLTVRII